MGNAFIYVVSFVLALGVLIAVHEFGHFWVARKLGVKVLRFSIGFGNPIWKKTSSASGTEYVLAAIPLGGYVKMLDEREGEVADDEKPLAFNNKPIRTRVAIVSAGPIFNFIFAIFALWVMYLSGIPGIKPIIHDAIPSSVAEKAGFVAGDLITRIGDKETPTWQVARLALFNNALDKELVEVEVIDAGGNRRLRNLDLRNVDTSLEVNDLISDVGLRSWKPPAILGDVKPGGPAAKAGLSNGDKIISLDNQPVADWIEWVSLVRKNPGNQVLIKAMRNGSLIETTVEIGMRVVGEEVTGFVDVQMPKEYVEKLFTSVRYGPLAALGQGVARTWEMSVLMLRVMGKMIIGEASLKNISGPITIAEFAGTSASRGLMPFLSFLAVVSISLGVLNLLPIPVLDGGHLFYYLIEYLKGSPVSEQMQSMGQQIGILLLVALMILAFYNDFARIFG
jgi:regulator of sigma E protease